MSNRLFHPIGLATLFALCLAASADARDRGVRVAPDLADAWILQLTPGSGVVPGYIKPDLAHPRGTYDGVALQGGGYSERASGAYRSRDIKDDPHEGGRPLHDRRATDPATTGSIVSAPSAMAAIGPATGRVMKRVDTIDPVFLPQQVDYTTDKAPGTVVIDTDHKFLYLVEEGGKARRYGVGVGKPGFEWAGTHTVSRKSEWPTWTPPSQMRAREKLKGKILPARMEGGPQNPLGARAMYLGSTLYRIHGTNQPWSIGKAVSSGCIRMRNEDVTDLYERVPVGTKVIVL